MSQHYCLERHDNKNIAYSERRLIPPGKRDPATGRIGVIDASRWKPGQVLRVRFLDGEPEVRAKVEEIAHTWSKYANITFQFGDDEEADVRITFTDKGKSYSLVGTDARAADLDHPTVNFGWLETDTADDVYRRVVLHEFGHVLGCIHEHASPAASIDWDKEAVYAAYAAPPNKWPRDKVDLNVFQRYSSGVSNSVFDRDSIMLYPIPARFLKSGDPVGWNTELSKLDKEFIASVYPFD